MPTENRTETSTLPSEPFTTNNLIVAPGAARGVISGESSEPGEPARSKPGSSTALEEEKTLWEGRYSSKNFIGRAILAGLFVLVPIVLALATWVSGYSNLWFWTYLVGGASLLYCCYMGVKFLRARRNHYYRLTSRRLLLTTGVFHRRVDQVELVRVKDLFVRQTMVGAWLDVGTVTLVSSEETLPKAVLLGVDGPQHVRDLIWHHTRLERDQRTSEVNAV